MSNSATLLGHRRLAKRLGRRAGIVRLLLGLLFLLYAAALVVGVPQQFSEVTKAETYRERIQNSVISGTALPHHLRAAEQELARRRAERIPLTLAAVVRAVQLTAIVYLAFGHLRRFSRSALESRFTQVHLDQLPALREALTKCTDKLGVDVSQLVVWSNRSKHVAPSVVTVKGVPQLLIPMGFLALLSRDTEAAEVMLAHELGHVVQQDSRLWIHAWLVSRLLLRILIPLDFVFLVLQLLLMTTALADQGASVNWVVALVACAFPVSVLLIVLYALAARSKSELAADVAAAGCFGPERVIATIQRYVSSDRGHGWGERLRARRLVALEELAAAG